MRIDCSKTVNYFAERQRMCRSGISCAKCPLENRNNGVGISCAPLEREYPDKAIKIVQKWSDEHPQKTYAEDFFEKFPNAPKEDDGTPKSCWRNIYGDGNCVDISHRCKMCWNRIMEDKPND